MCVCVCVCVYIYIYIYIYIVFKKPNRKKKKKRTLVGQLAKPSQSPTSDNNTVFSVDFLVLANAP